MARGFHAAPGASPEVDDVTRPGLSKAALAVHGQSKNPLVREIVAGRADCSLGLLVTLAHDRNAEVRAAVAGNPGATPAILEHLSADRSVDVLTALLENPSITADLVEKLAFHRKDEIRRSAALRLDELAGDEPPPPTEDAATPELRDVGEASEAYVRADAPPMMSRADIRRERIASAGTARPTSPLTRTAPVRGFRPPPGADALPDTKP